MRARRCSGRRADGRQCGRTTTNPSGWCGLCSGPLSSAPAQSAVLADQSSAEPHVTLEVLGEAHEQSWVALDELTAKVDPRRWVLTGGQAVLLHAAEQGREPPRVTTDADFVVDLRAQPRATTRVAQALLDLGFTCDVGPNNEGHRFRRGEAAVDLLAPDGVGKRATLTTIPGFKTVEAPGGTQALRRAEFVRVHLGGTHSQGRTVRLRRVSLLGAIVGKAHALSLPGEPAKHRKDAWFLLSLVDDPYRLAQEVTRSDRQPLSVLAAGPGPVGLNDEEAADARNALNILLGR